jgi:hypothetical protein
VETFVFKIQSEWRPSILQGDCNHQNILSRALNISLWVIELRKKKGSYSSVFKTVEGKLLCLKFNLNGGRQSYWVIPNTKYIVQGVNHLALSNRVGEKEGFLFGLFSRLLRVLKRQSL